MLDNVSSNKTITILDWEMKVSAEDLVDVLILTWFIIIYSTWRCHKSQNL